VRFFPNNIPGAIAAIERVLLTLWVGGMWLTGLVLAPLLFASYPRAVAGDIAGRLFAAVSFVGIGCALPLLASAVAHARQRWWRNGRVLVLCVMLAITVFGEFGLAARMRELRQIVHAQPQGTELWKEFGRLHGVANALFLVNAMLGLVLVITQPRPAPDQAGN
jgi:hypothetical protein